MFRCWYWSIVHKKWVFSSLWETKKQVRHYKTSMKEYGYCVAVERVK